MIAILEEALSVGWTHILTHGGPVPIAEWRPYDRSPEEIPLELVEDGTVLEDQPIQPVNLPNYCGRWPLVRIPAGGPQCPSTK